LKNLKLNRQDATFFFVIENSIDGKQKRAYLHVA